jgi:trehalose 6-phosphate synthase/phosphatase
VLWPLFHYLTDRIDRQAWTHWEAYEAVNRRYADAVIAQYREGDAIWVHDYQLALVPRLLREALPEARIGYFLHIPFPSSEVFRVLPWRKEILEGMLGASLIGFHTPAYRRHFIHAANEYADPYQDVKIGVFPMGIDAKRFAEMAASSEVRAELDKLHQSDDRRLILGVDRLDYTKGLQRRLLAFEELLARNEDLRDRVKMLQIVVPSRTSVATYEAYKRDLEELVGSINGRYSTLHNDSVRYLFQSVSLTELVALYRAAEVMFVTPLRDGMNLVAKEFAASRIDEDGVLVLSELAGAAQQMGEHAVLVNPYDIDGVANALTTALKMPEAERRKRMRALRQGVFDSDAFHWTETFLDALLHHQEQPVQRASNASSRPLHELPG